MDFMWKRTYIIQVSNSFSKTRYAHKYILLCGGDHLKFVIAALLVIFERSVQRICTQHHSLVLKHCISYRLTRFVCGFYSVLDLLT